MVAPVAGEVVGLKVHTVGAAIGPREPVLDIVPADSQLVIEARIAPSDIRDAQQAMSHGRSPTSCCRPTASVPPRRWMGD